MKNKVTVNIILQVYIIFEIIKLKKKKINYQQTKIPNIDQQRE